MIQSLRHLNLLKSDSYFQADSRFFMDRSSFAGNRQMGGASFDSQQSMALDTVLVGECIEIELCAQRGGRNGRGYAHGRQSSWQFGMLQSSQQAEDITSDEGSLTNPIPGFFRANTWFGSCYHMTAMQEDLIRLKASYHCIPLPQFDVSSIWK